MIGYKITLRENKDKIGLKLWDELNQLTLKNNKINKNKIKELLQEIPLYYLLSFLGYAHYKVSFIKN